MKNATLAQWYEITGLILQLKVSCKQLQKIRDSGLLADLLTGNVDNVDRNAFRVMLGHSPWGVIRIVHSYAGASHYNPQVRECEANKSGCRSTPLQEAFGKTHDGKKTICVRCCSNAACQIAAQKRAEEALILYKWSTDKLEHPHPQSGVRPGHLQTV